jgi:ParB family chromosome partitioning protein
MTVKKPTLGRGLADLLGQARPRPIAPVALQPAPSQLTPAPPAPAPAPQVDEMAHLRLDQLQRGRYQPRVDMRQEALEELAISIRSQGVIQPIVVRPLDSADSAGGPRYEIIAGERRWRAAQIAGLSTIPAVIRRVPDDAAIAMALIENIQREDLNPLEEARALERLIAEFGLTHQQSADAVGRSRAAVSNLLRLLELAPEVAELVEKRQLEMGHARTLLALTNRRQQAEVGALVARNGLSVRETEALVRKMLNPAAGKASAATQRTDPNVSQLQDSLSDKLGAKVLIQQGSGGKGKLVVSYNSLDELDGILAHIQ